MQTFQHDELDADVLEELLEEISELYEASEQILIELELAPQDNEMQRALFRAIHTIKGDLGLVNFSPLLPLLQCVEDLLDFLRKGQIAYTSTMSDLVLLTMDRVKLFVKSCIKEGQAEYDANLFDQLVIQIGKIRPDNQAQHETLLGQSVLLLDPSLDATEQVEQQIRQQQKGTALGHLGMQASLNEEQQADILFFRRLMEPVEERSKYWGGRCDRVAKLALYLNRQAGSPVDEKQLVVACYVYDFGMAFMPLSLLHKVDNLEQNEFNLMRSHVFKSAKLLEHLDYWNEARKIVIQHHERMDGSGYPMGLKDSEICEGAKLLGIVDTFDGMTHSRAHASHVTRPKKRAVADMNKIADGQFCPEWMKIFNQTMASLLTK